MFVPLKMDLDVAVRPYHEQFSVDSMVNLRIWIQCVDDAGLLVWIGIPDVPPQAVQVTVTGTEEVSEGPRAPEPPKFEDYGPHMAPLPDLEG